MLLTIHAQYTIFMNQFIVCALALVYHLQSVNEPNQLYFVMLYF